MKSRIPPSCPRPRTPVASRWLRIKNCRNPKRKSTPRRCAHIGDCHQRRLPAGDGPGSIMAPTDQAYWAEEKEEAPVGVGPTMADLQSAALATWLRRLCFEASVAPARLQRAVRQESFSPEKTQPAHNATDSMSTTTACQQAAILKKREYRPTLSTGGRPTL
jgi:hypothetical protein